MPELKIYILPFIIAFLWANLLPHNALAFDSTNACGNLGKDDVTQSIECWIEINRVVSDTLFTFEDEIAKKEASYELLGNHYLRVYYDTGSIPFLIFALHEYDTVEREKVISGLDSETLKLISGDLAKLTDRSFEEGYFNLRPFEFSDLFHFQGTNITAHEHITDQVFELLDYWYDELPKLYSQNQLLGKVKVLSLVNGYYRLRDFEKVHSLKNYFLQGTKIPSSHRKISTLRFVAFSSVLTGHYRDALNFYTDILLPEAERLGDLSEELMVKMDYANVLFRLGNMTSALTLYEEIFEYEQYLTDSGYRAALFNNLAISYLNAGSFEQYVNFQLSAYEIAREEQNLRHKLSILRNLHIVYRLSRNNELALNYINEALEIAEENNLTKEISSILVAIGVYNREVLFNYEDALRYLYRSLDITEEDNDYFALQSTLIEIARTYQYSEDFSSAKVYFEQAAEVNLQRDDELAYFQTSIRLANMHLHAGNDNKAREIIDSLIDVDLERLRIVERAMKHNVMHKIMLQEGDFEEALVSSSKHIAELENWFRGSTDTQTGQMLVEREYTEAYRIHMEILHTLDKPVEMIEVNERLRSISRSAFFNNPLLKSSMLSEDDMLTDYALGNRIQRLRGELAESSGQERIEIGNELMDAINRRNQLLNQVIKVDDTETEQFQPRDLQRALGRNQMVLYFAIFGDYIFQIEITRNNIKTRKHNAARELITLIEETRASFKPGQTNLLKLHDLYTHLFSDTNPEQYNTIYVVPDGMLYQLPFEILPVSKPNSANSYGSTTYLIEKTEISYVNTISDLMREPRQITPTFDYAYAGFGISDFAAAGHPGMSNLPFATVEVSTTKNKLRNLQPAALFTDHEVTKREFTRMAGNTRVMHLATHSIVENQNPLFSALYLFADEPNPGSSGRENGVIRAYNLFEMNMTTDLVVLSSCESASGEYIEGSGILGLSRAFTYAGAQSLLMNLWPVKDQTASHITSIFFGYLDQGYSKSTSLRQARLDYLNSVNSDPFLWGGYVLHGNAAPLQPPSFLAQNALVIGLLLFGLTAGLLLLYYRRRYSI